MIILGIVFIILGVVMLAYNRQIYSFTGGIDFVESHFRAGTPSFLKLIAVVLVLGGIMLATGISSWLTAPLQQVFDSFQLK